jgi:hypothetical protein
MKSCRRTHVYKNARFRAVRARVDFTNGLRKNAPHAQAVRFYRLFARQRAGLCYNTMEKDTQSPNQMFLEMFHDGIFGQLRHHQTP